VRAKHHDDEDDDDNDDEDDDDEEEEEEMNLTELSASLNRQKGGFDRWAHSRLNAVESIRQKHQIDMKKANTEYEELKENQEK